MTKTLGELIQLLEGLPVTHTVRLDVPFRLGISGIGSWRGDYAELSLHYDAGYTAKELNVGQLLLKLREVQNTRLEGWKGGSYMMTRSTLVWIDCRGCYSGAVGITDVVDDGYEVRVQFRKED